MILLIDNYDSFTYNLAQQFAGQEIEIVRNDHPSLMERARQAAAVVLSPGPGRPEAAGYMLTVIQQLAQEKPFLGVCLGHQGIGQVFGGAVVEAPEIMHGKQSIITYTPTGLFEGITGAFPVMRYHSLVLAPETIPEELEVVATVGNCIMAVQHRQLPVYGVQFHPESIGTPCGQQLINNFINIVEARK